MRDKKNFSSQGQCSIDVLAKCAYEQKQKLQLHLGKLWYIAIDYKPRWNQIDTALSRITKSYKNDVVLKADIICKDKKIHRNMFWSIHWKSILVNDEWK